MNSPIVICFSVVLFAVSLVTGYESNQSTAVFTCTVVI